jgi:adenylate kinase
MAFAGKVIVVAGPPCSGKGTQCKRLAERLGLVHVSTGDVFRDAVTRCTPLGLEAKGYLDRGLFVPDELMIQFVTTRLAEPDVLARGCLLDGFPRTGPQARTLAAAVEVERFIVLQMPDKALLTRAAARRIDPTDGAIYNLKYVLPPAEIVGRLEQRKYDDDAGTFQVRLDVYHKHIRQIIPCFGQRVWMVDAMRQPDAVFEDLARCLEATVSSGPADSGAKGQAEVAPTEAPRQFVCAITQEVMQDPVTTADGQVYEREAIETWLQQKNTSPLTGQVLKHKQLTPSAALRRTIERWAEGSITAEEALSGSAYEGPGTLTNPVARDSTALDEEPAPTGCLAGLSRHARKRERRKAARAAREASAASAAPATEEVDAGAAQEVGVSIALGGRDAGGVHHVVVEVSVPEAPRREPVDICCVVDVSGSMSNAATHEAPDGTIQNDGLSILDLVKHAVKTLAHMMMPEDRLSLVTFSNTGTLRLPPTLMSDAGRATAIQVTESLATQGATNIWDGLQKGLDCLRETSTAAAAAGVPGRQSTVLLLTDGMPNNIPKRGHRAELQDYMAAHPDFAFQISTFGFGYALDSELLLEIASLGRGSYGFIPDAKILGTVFVNALANAVATCSQRATLRLRVPAPATSEETPATILGPPLGDYSSSKREWGLQVDLGPLQYGQKHSIAVPMTLPMLATAGDAPPPYLEAKLLFSRPDSREQEQVVASGNARSPSPAAVLAALRCDVITSGRLAVAEGVSGKMDDANARVRALLERFAPTDRVLRVLPAGTEGHEAMHTVLQQLQSDVEGRLTKSFDGKARFDRWGRHYVRALLRAHQLQLQTNFMDQGLKSYGGALFQQVRDAGGPIFQSIPAPQPQRRVASSVASTPAPAPDMSRYYEGEGGGCFGRGSTALVSRFGNLANDDEFVRTDVTAVQPGDFVRVAGGGIAEVVYVAKIAEPAGATLCELPSGLRITSKHPIRVDGEWQRPSELPEARTVQNSDGFVVNFVLRGDDGRMHEHGHVLLVNGVECATWGHGLKGAVIGDAFFGTEKVVSALAAKCSDEGRVDLRGSLRDENGAVVGFA